MSQSLRVWSGLSTIPCRRSCVPRRPLRHEHIAGADSGTLRATDQGVMRGCVSGSASGAHPRAHRGPEREPGRGCEDEFLQAVPQDESVEERQTEVHFP